MPVCCTRSCRCWTYAFGRGLCRLGPAWTPLANALPTVHNDFDCLSRLLLTWRRALQEGGAAAAGLEVEGVGAEGTCTSAPLDGGRSSCDSFVSCEGGDSLMADSACGVAEGVSADDVQLQLVRSRPWHIAMMCSTKLCG